MNTPQQGEIEFPIHSNTPPNSIGKLTKYDEKGNLVTVITTFTPALRKLSMKHEYSDFFKKNVYTNDDGERFIFNDGSTDVDPKQTFDVQINKTHSEPISELIASSLISKDEEVVNQKPILSKEKEEARTASEQNSDVELKHGLKLVHGHIVKDVLPPERD